MCSSDLAVDNQPSVEIHVLQGERPMAKDNRSIGRFHLDGIPPARRGVPQIEVVFDIDVNGIISVSAIDKGTNKTQNIRIEASSGLSKEEIERMKQDAELNADADAKAKEEAETINMADSTIFNLEKTLEDMKDKISEEDKVSVQTALDELKKAHSDRNVEEIKVKLDNVNNTFQKISEKMYQSQPTNEQTGGDDVKDVEFEEVK